MKIILLLFLFSTIYADDMKVASSIFNLIASAVTQKTNPNVYLHSQVEAIEKDSGSLVRVLDCSKADIIFLSTLKDIPVACDGKILFGTRYPHLKDSRVIGAFFWQKGRPNILFYKDRLKKNSIKLNSNFDKYIE